jgi:hypothetical protein
VSGYRIGADRTWWYLFGPDHQLIRRFKQTSWTKDEVRAFRRGWIAAEARQA